MAQYESQQVQDNETDSVLRKISDAPEYFLLLLENVCSALLPNAYMQYRAAAEKVVA